MRWDEMDDRLLRAAETDPQAVERVVKAALARHDAGTRVWHRTAFASLAACVVTVAAAVVWWSGREPAGPPGGVFRASAVPAPLSPEAPAATPVVPAGPAGASRVVADAARAPSRVICLTVDDGTTWILSTVPRNDWLAPGERVVVGGQGAR